MRRVICITMVVFGLSMAITGLMKLFAPFDSAFFPPHAITSIVFSVLVIIHILLNRKPLLRYFKG
jgi:uncharacterized membrane protein